MSASAADTRFRVSDLLRAAWPANTAKHAATAAGQSYRTAEGWISERCTPSATALLRMAERNDRLRKELLTRLAYLEMERNGGMATHTRGLGEAQASDLPVAGGVPAAPRKPIAGPRPRVAKEG